MAAREFFGGHPTVRRSAAVNRYLNGPLSAEDAASLAGVPRSEFERMVERATGGDDAGFDEAASPTPG